MKKENLFFVSIKFRTEIENISQLKSKIFSSTDHEKCDIKKLSSHKRSDFFVIIYLIVFRCGSSVLSIMPINIWKIFKRRKWREDTAAFHIQSLWSLFKLIINFNNEITSRIFGNKNDVKNSTKLYFYFYFNSSLNLVLFQADALILV